MPTVVDRALVDITINQDGTGGTDGIFDPQVFQRTTTHQPVWSGAVTHTGTQPSAAPASAADVVVQCCVWATRELEFRDNGLTGLSAIDLKNITDLSGILADYAGTDIVPFDINTNGVVTLRSAFIRAENLNLDVSNWDTSSVSDMSYVFYDAKAMTPDTSGWDTSSVTSMPFMFYLATSANPDTSSWDTSSVTSMSSTFRNAQAWTRYSDLLNWSFANVTDMSNIFNGISIPTSDIDALLNHIQSNPHQLNVSLHLGNSNYSSAGQAAHDALVADGWVITSNGLI